MITPWFHAVSCGAVNLPKFVPAISKAFGRIGSKIRWWCQVIQGVVRALPVVLGNPSFIIWWGGCMSTKTQILIYILVLAVFDTIIPIPITALVLIHVLYQKPKWFRDWVEEVYHSWSTIQGITISSYPRHKKRQSPKGLCRFHPVSGSISIVSRSVQLGMVSVAFGVEALPLS